MNLPWSIVTSSVTGCGSGFIGPTIIAFTQALNPRPAMRSGRETATAVGCAVKSVSAPARTNSLTSGSGSGAGGSVLGCRRIFGTKGGVLVGHFAARQQRRGAGEDAHGDLHRRHGGKQPWSAGWKATLLPNAAFFVSAQPGRVAR